MLNVVRVDICVLFLILEEMFLVFHHYDVSYELVIDDLYYAEICSLYTHFVENFLIINGC